MFPCNPLMNLVVWSALALAQTHHPLRVVAVHMEGTHLHMIVVVDNPDDVKDFMERFKTESAHAVNRLLGRRKRTVWCEGYHSAPLLNEEAVLNQLVYLYVNPVKDGLVESISEYPGVTSYKMLRTNTLTRSCPRVRRSTLGFIKKRKRNLRGFLSTKQQIEANSSETLVFAIEPKAWMGAFNIVEKERQDLIHNELFERIRAYEVASKSERAQARARVMGAERLMRQAIDPSYVPERSGHRACCICPGDKELRKRFIQWVKDLIYEARMVYQRWKSGDFSVPYPLGLYPPSMPKLAEPIMSAQCVP